MGIGVLGGVTANVVLPVTLCVPSVQLADAVPPVALVVTVQVQETKPVAAAVLTPSLKSVADGLLPLLYTIEGVQVEPGIVRA